MEEQSEPGAVRTAHAALGQLFAREAVQCPQLLPRCAQHWQAAGRPAEVGEALRRWVAQARRAGDRRRLASLASIPAEPWWAEFCFALHAGSRGVPLLALEVLQLAMERGHLARDETGWCCRDPGALLTQVRQGGPLRYRIAQLRREERWLLLLLALAGTPLGVLPLASAAARAADDVDEDLNHL